MQATMTSKTFQMLATILFASLAYPATASTFANRGAGILGDFELAEIYTDHMVLQRDHPIPVTGKALPNAEVSVRLGGQAEVVVVANAAGKWTAVLPARGAATGLRLIARSGPASVILTNVAVGDVFLCSGQSNMEFPLRLATDADNAIASSARDELRLFKVPRQSSAIPLTGFASATSWHVSNPESVREFSAACYFMGVELLNSRRVPIGLIASSWGGSFIEAWLGSEVLAADEKLARGLDMLTLWHRDPDSAERNWQSEMDAYFARGFSRVGPEAVADPSRIWEEWEAGFGEFDGFGTYSRTVNLTKQQALAAKVLSLGTIDDLDETFVNGRLVGSSAGWNLPRRYELPEGLLVPGDNQIEVRVLDTGGGGGIYGAGPRSLISASGVSLPLDGGWRFRPGQSLADAGPVPRKPWMPTSGLGTLANGMIAPLGRIPLAGVAWYQGESNASDPTAYEEFLPKLIAEWRDRFDTRPFVIVQLANFGQLSSNPQQSNWAELREVQRRVAATDPDIGLAITIDIGDPYDIHPANKRSVGLRLASAMDGRSRDVLPRMTIAADGSSLQLDYYHDLLVVGGLGVIGFEACRLGNCRFVDARLLDQRTISIPLEPGDDTIRYLWSNSPISNLFDGGGTPVTPFESSLRSLDDGSLLKVGKGL